MKPEIRIPDSALVTCIRYGLPVIIDEFWARFVLENNFRLYGRVVCDIYDESLFIMKKTCMPYDIIILYKGEYYAKYEDSKNRDYFQFFKPTDCLYSQLKIHRNTLTLRAEKISFVKAKLKF